jgi:hypothetical protein
VFWSKIWFFLVAVAAAIALTFALALPRPAATSMVNEEHRRLAVACGVINILLADDARKRVDLAGSFARSEDIVKALESASAAPALDEARMKQVRATAETVMKGITGDRKPDFAMLIDKKGRVVARVRLDEQVFGDLATGRPLVDDALAGYLRDDLWVANGTVYVVSASPVVKLPDYIGAVVLGHQVTNELAQKLVGSLRVDVGFYLGDNTVATSKTIALDQATLATESGKLTGGDLARDCQANEPFPLRAGTEKLTGIVARLPGEATARRAFYTVFINRPVERGFMASLKAVTKDDLSFGSFPWIFVAGGFLLVLGGGIALMLLEADRPLRRLAAESVRLAKGDIEKLGEDAHPGKFGSIARSVNIHLDKMGREASRSSKKDIEQLLGPAPEGSLGTIDLLATALPAIRPGGSSPSLPPPPSEFKFGESSSGSRPMPAAPSSSSGPAHPRAGTPPPAPPRTPPLGVPKMSPGMTPPAGVPKSPPGMTPPVGVRQSSPAIAPPAAAPAASAASASLNLGDDLLDDELIDEPSAPAVLPAAPSSAPGGSRVDPYFKQVFDQFIAVKKSCSESIAGLTYDKFAEKLIRNRDELRSKTGCREVRFTVYVKDGKAALKATPVKDD